MSAVPKKSSRPHLSAEEIVRALVERARTGSGEHSIGDMTINQLLADYVQPEHLKPKDVKVGMTVSTTIPPVKRGGPRTNVVVVGIWKNVDTGETKYELQAGDRAPLKLRPIEDVFPPVSEEDAAKSTRRPPVKR